MDYSLHIEHIHIPIYRKYKHQIFNNCVTIEQDTKKGIQLIFSRRRDVNQIREILLSYYLLEENTF
jgi:hypothetical protein